MLVFIESSYPRIDRFNNRDYFSRKDIEYATGTEILLTCKKT